MDQNNRTRHPLQRNRPEMVEIGFRWSGLLVVAVLTLLALNLPPPAAAAASGPPLTIQWLPNHSERLAWTNDGPLILEESRGFNAFSSSTRVFKPVPAPPPKHLPIVTIHEVGSGTGSMTL